MSDREINWYNFIYPAIAIPVAVLCIVRFCIIMKRRRAAQSQVVTTINANNGSSSLDYVMDNPHMHQSTTPYNIEQPPAYNELYKQESKKVQDESPSMIQSKRWF